jgi:hypothetical protein
MSDASSLNEFFGWNKLLMGWIKDEEVRCVQNQVSSTHYLSDFSSSLGTKLLLVNLKPGVTIAMESRNNYSSGQGLLVYKIDTNINHGDGPITAEKLLLRKGEKKSIDNWNIEVQDTSTIGLLVNVTKSS